MILALAAALSLAADAPRPSIECSAHLTDAAARRTCLQDLLTTAEAALAAAHAAAREEAEDIDLELPGHARAAQRLDAAQTAWSAYAAAECERRAALLMIGEAGEEARLDCRISLARARAAELRDH